MEACVTAELVELCRMARAGLTQIWGLFQILELVWDILGVAGSGVV